MTFARGRNKFPDDERWQSVCCVRLETSIDIKEMFTAKRACDLIIWRDFHLYIVVPALYYLFRVADVFLEIFCAYTKRQIKIVPVCIGLGFKQIYCVAHKDNIVYVDVDLHVVDISVRVH